MPLVLNQWHWAQTFTEKKIRGLQIKNNVETTDLENA